MSIEKLKARYRANMDAGLCRCGNERAPNRKSCQVCLDRDAAKQRERRRESRRIGRCSHCNSRQARPGGRICQRCSDSISKDFTRRYYRRKDNNQCPACGGDPEPGFIHCEWCLHVVRCRFKGISPY